MTRAELRQAIDRLLGGDPRHVLRQVQAHRERIGGGVTAADWNPERMDDATLAAVLAFGLVALWWWQGGGDPSSTVSEPIPDIAAAFAEFSRDNSPVINPPQPPGPPVPGPQPGPQPPSQGGDQIDIESARVVGGSPNFLAWPITRQLAITQLEPAIVPSFDPGDWPPVVPAGFEGGNVQYTVAAFAPVGDGGLWVGSGFIEMWQGRPDCGAQAFPTVREQLWRNWWYYVPELAGYLPASGDPIAFCVVAGDMRGGDKGPSVRERSNLVIVNMP